MLRIFVQMPLCEERRSTFWTFIVAFPNTILDARTAKCMLTSRDYMGILDGLQTDRALKGRVIDNAFEFEKSRINLESDIFWDC